MKEIPSNDVIEQFRIMLDWAKSERPTHFTNKDINHYLEKEIAQNADDNHTFWLYLGVETLAKCMTSKLPNLWVHEVKNNKLRMGVIFNNNPSFDRLQSVLRHSDVLMNKLKEQTNWVSRVYTREKLINPLSPAHYVQYADPIYELHENSEKKSGCIMTFWDDANCEAQRRTKLPKSHSDFIYTGSGASVSLIEKDILFEEKTFKESFSFAYEVLQICLTHRLTLF